MGNIELNFLEELVLYSKTPGVTKEEIDNFLKECPDSVKEAFQIITENKPNYVKQLAN